VKLTLKDKEFLEKLKDVFEELELSIEPKRVGITRLVLRKNYGARVESHFGMTRQGVRWRFHRLFSEIYVNAYVTILWIESNFGTHLRQQAMAIAKERMEMYQRAKREGTLVVPKRTGTR
jgi:hypothetical protein